MLREGSVQEKFKLANNSEIDIVVPGIGIGDWHFEDFAYHKDDATSVELQLILEKNDQHTYVIEKTSITALDHFFQLKKKIKSGTSVRFKTTGANGGGFDHHVLITFIK